MYSSIGLAPALPLSLLLSLDPAAASPTIDWSSNHACPGAELDLERVIASRLRADAAELARVEARVQLFDAGPAGLRLELEIASQAGTEAHQIAALDCERLLEQAALLIASAVDPFVYHWSAPDESAARQHHRAVAVQRPRDSVVVVSPSSPSSPISPSSPSSPIIEQPRRDDSLDVVHEFGPLEPAEPERDKPPISGTLGVGATTFVGLFPSIGGGFEVEGALERGPLRWQTAANGWFGGRFRSTEAEVGGDLWALGLASALCGVPAAKRVRVPLCATAGAGLIAVRAVGTVEPRRSVQPWAWAGAEARVLLLAREDLAVGLGVGAQAALVRPAWEVRSPGVRFTVPPVMGVLRLTFEARQLRRKKSSATGITSR